MKCGLRGTWGWIKGQKCKGSPTIETGSSGSAPNHQNLGEPLNAMSSKLDQSLKEGDNKMAMEIMDMMELQDAEERLQDQELALQLQLMEEEVLMLEMAEEMHQLELLQLEQEELKACEVLKDSQKNDRPPATPMTSTTPIPVVETSVGT